VPPGERTALERAWADQVYQWSVVLGFRYGLSPQEVATASLEGLSRPGQGADLARAELARHRHLFEARYEIRIGSEGG
jgi:hypothetical protein